MEEDKILIGRIEITKKAWMGSDDEFTKVFTQEILGLINDIYKQREKVLKES